MATITFDTHEYVKALRNAGIPELQAEAFASVQKNSLAEVMDSSLATKGDIQEVRDRILLVEAELKLLKWMTGTIMALCIAILVRLFLR